ncbi:MAG: TonB-dependent receptor plug domain-containing protein [Burkholderiales bacterium]
MTGAGIAVAVAVIALPLACAAAPDGTPNAGGLLGLSLEALGDIEVTSVSRHAQPLLDAPAAIYVISNEDIRRSGATSLADALRLAPNLQVAQVTSSTYAISARGFNNAIGNKLLVLIDGRTVYSPLFSGTFWDVQDVMLEDLDRIEVISGPGATLWGANAVNGVINVITKRASDTQGLLASIGGGDTDNVYSLRYGGRLGDVGAFRAYAKFSDHQQTVLANGNDAMDGWNRNQGGFRADWSAPGGDWTLQGETYSNDYDPNIIGRPNASGANLLARWSRKDSDGSSSQVQAYYDYAQRDDYVTFRDRMSLLDIAFQNGTPLTPHQRLEWGGGYREARDRTEPSLLIAFIPADRDLHWENLYAQDEIALAKALTLTAGAKLETNVYTGTEFLPTLRLAWKLDPRRLLWGALSRAVRAPARIDREFFFPGAPPYYILGGPDFQSEVFDVAEVGYRAQPSTRLSYSVSVYRNLDLKLRSGEPPPAVVQNMIEGSTTGLEAWGSFQVTPTWTLSAGATTLHQDLHMLPGSTDPVGPSALGNDPDFQWMLRSSLNLPRRQEFDVSVRRVAALPDPVVPAYTAVDARWGWHVSKAVEVSLTLSNALDPEHIEFGAGPTASEIARSAFFNVRWEQ